MARFNAGTVMLQVAPSMRGFHKKVGREAEAAGELIEKRIGEASEKALNEEIRRREKAEKKLAKAKLANVEAAGRAQEAQIARQEARAAAAAERAAAKAVADEERQRAKLDAVAKKATDKRAADEARAEKERTDAATKAAKKAAAERERIDKEHADAVEKAAKKAAAERERERKAEVRDAEKAARDAEKLAERARARALADAEKEMNAAQRRLDKEAEDAEKAATRARNRARKLKEDEAARAARDEEKAQKAALREVERGLAAAARAQEREEKANQKRLERETAARAREIERQEKLLERAAERRAVLAERLAEKEARLRERAEQRQALNDGRLRQNMQMAELDGRASVATLDDRATRRLAKQISQQFSAGEVKIPVELTGEGEAVAQYNALRSRLESLRGMKIGVDIDSRGFAAEYAAIVAAMRRLNGMTANPDVRMNSAKFLAEAAAMGAAQKGMASGSKDLAKSNEEMENSTGGAANSFRAMNGMLLAAVTIGPALIPILGGITAGLLGVAAGAMTVGTALGVGLLGLSGIGGALSALSDRDKDVRKKAATPKKPDSSTSNDEAARARAIRDAVQGLSDARRAAARAEEKGLRAIADAEKNLADAKVDAAERSAKAEQDLVRARADALARNQRAEESLANSQKSARKAQETLNEARRQAARDVEDLALRVRGAALDEQQSVYDMQRARIRYNAVLEDDQATSRERDEARIAYEQAILQNEEMKLSNERLAEEAKKSEEQGIEGSEAVVRAKEDVRDANLAVMDAEKAVRTTSEEGRESVLEAEREVVDTRLEGIERIADAELRLSDSVADMEETRYQSMRRIQDAQERLADALARSSSAAAAGVDEFDSSLFELNESMNKLSPAGQRFAEWLYGLKPLLDLLRFNVQETFLPGLQTALGNIIDRYGPEFAEFMSTMGTALGDSSIAFSDWLTSPEMATFFETMAENMPAWLGIFTDITTGGLGGLLGIFTALAPAATTIGQAIADAALGFSAWANSEEGQESLQKFGDYLVQIGPEVWQLFAAAVGALASIFEALSPFGEQVMTFLTAFFAWISDMDPETLSVIVRGILALVAAFQILFTILALVGTVLGLAAVGISGVVLAVIAIVIVAVVAIIYFWDEISTFFKNVGKTVSEWYDKNLAPTVDKIGKAFNWVYEEVIKPVWNAVAAVFKWVWDEIILPIFQNLQSWFSIIGAAVGIVYNLWVIAWDLVGGLFSKLWNDYLSPVWENHIKPFFDTIGNFIEKEIKPAWEKGVELLGEVWDKLKGLVAKPVKWVIDSVINDGVIDKFNSFAKNFPGTVEIPRIPLPGWAADYATGGVLPGYTPGRDVHTFRSPTGGTLNLSGGEAILRPEVTRALGKRWVDKVNGLAMSGGTHAVMRHVGGFASGGVLPTLGSAGPVSSFSLGGIWDGIKDIAGGAVDALKDVVDSVAQFIKDPTAALQAVVDGLIGTFSGGDMDGTFGSMVKGVPKKVVQVAADYVRSIFTDSVIADADAAKAAEAAVEASGGLAGAPVIDDGGRTWVNPSQGPVTSRYGMRFLFGRNNLHAGTDIAGGGPTYAASNGIVRDVGWNLLTGRTGYGVLVQHTPQLTTYYGHNPTNGVFVNKGQVVAPGQRLGTQGKTGQVTGVHLHYEVATGGNPNSSIDSYPFMLQRGIKLGQNAPLYDEGGYLRPGLNTVLNATGKPEPVLTTKQLDLLTEAAGLRSSDVGSSPLAGATFYSYDPSDVADRLRIERNRDLAMAGLAEIGVTL